ncbi:MAG: hypothetical protein V3W06_09160 [Acidimicrobiia bacterium]
MTNVDIHDDVPARVALNVLACNAGGTAYEARPFQTENMSGQAANDYTRYDGTDWINRTIAQVQVDMGIGADLLAIEALATTGILARTAADTWLHRTITGTTDEIDVTNGDGVGGNPTLALAAAPTFSDFTNANHDHEDAAGGGTLDHNLATDNPTVAHGATGAVVGTTNTQTLTNKTIADFTNDVSANDIHEELRNESGGTMNMGDAVFISGYNGGLNIALVTLADASAAGTMPCVALLNQSTLANNATGDFIEVGTVANVDTIAWAVGDEIWVSATGTTTNTLTNVKPTGTDLIQKVAVVLRSHATLGILEVFGAGRTNDLPNIPTDSLWVGDGSAVPTATGSTGTGLIVRQGSPSITTPTIASFANAAHDHADAAGGAQITATTGLADFKANSVLLNDSASAAAPQIADELDIATVSPAGADFLLGWTAAGLLRKYTVTSLPGGAEVNDLETSCQDILINEIAVGSGTDTAAYVDELTLNAETVVGADFLIGWTAAGVISRFTVSDLPSAGANTLDAAYREGGAGAGRSIDPANAGAVRITAASIAGDDLLDIDHVIGVTSTTSTQDVAVITSDRTDTSGNATLADDFSTLFVEKISRKNNATGSITVAGAVILAQQQLTQDGAGTATSTVNIYEGRFNTVSGTENGRYLALYATAAETDPEFSINGDGSHNWGDGTAATDTSLTRTAAGVLDLVSILDVNTGLRVAGAATTGNYLRGDGTNFISGALTLTDASQISGFTGTTPGDLVVANSPTIVTPTIASLTNAQHDHADAAGGGSLGTAVVTLAMMANLKEYSLIGKDTAGSGAPLNLDELDLPTEAAPTTGDWILGWDAAGLLVKYDVGTLPAGSETNTLSTICTGIGTDNVPVGSGANVATYTGTSGTGVVLRQGSPTITTPIIVTTGSITDAGGDPYLTFVEVATPANDFQMAQGLTTAPCVLTAIGEANAGMQLTGSGTGTVEIIDPEVAATDWTNANHTHAAANSGGTIAITDTTGTLLETSGGTGTATYTAGDILYSDAANSLAKLAKGTAGQHLRMNSGATIPEWATEEKSKSITIEDPVDGDIFAMWITNKAITVTELQGICEGGTSVVIDLEFATTVITGGTQIETITPTTAITSDTAPSGDATVPADQVILVDIGTVTGSVNSVTLTVNYTED